LPLLSCCTSLTAGWAALKNTHRKEGQRASAEHSLQQLVAAEPSEMQLLRPM
jgi:hypothetical protein